MMRSVSAFLLMLVVICGVPADAIAQYAGMIGASRPTYLTTPLESLGVSSSNTASANTTAIQSALTNIGGQLTLMTCGTYQINAELQIGDNTTLELAPCVIMQRAAANMNMISTKAYHATPSSITLSAVNTSTVTFTSASPTVVTWSGMPLVEGQAVVFSTSNTLPTGVTAATVYIVRDVGTGGNANQFHISLGTSAGGAALINTSSTGVGTQTATQTGVTVKVTWTSHGLVQGNWFSVINANQSYYNGTFQVDSVPDANTIVYRTKRTPLAAPSGTITAVKANENISLIGGTWDYNYPTFNKSPLLDAVGLFGFLHNLRIDNIRIKNGGTYGFDVGAVTQSHVSNVSMVASSNGQETVKHYGPAYQVLVENISGQNTDDVASFMTQENPSAFPLYIWTKGDLIDCTARNIFADGGVNVGNVVALYSGGAGYSDQIHFDGIYGSTNAAPSSSAHLILLSGYAAADPVGLVTINHVRGWSVVNSINIDYGTYQRVVITDVVYGGQPAPATTAIATFSNSSYIYVSPVATVYDLVVDGWSLPNGLTVNYVNEYDVVYVDAAIIGNLTLRNIQIYTGNQVAALRVAANSNIAVINVYDMFVSNSLEPIEIRSGLATTTWSTSVQVNVFGGWFQSNGIIYTASASTVNIVGAVVQTASQGIVTSDQNVNIDIFWSGVKFGVNPWTHAYGNSPVFRFHGYDSTSGPTLTGNTGTCSTNVTVTGGARAGTWTSSSNPACAAAGTIILTGMPPATTGYACHAEDRTLITSTLTQTATSTTSVTFTVGAAAIAQNNIVQFMCVEY